MAMMMTMAPLFFLFFVLQSTITAAATCNPSDRAALLSFRSALSDPSSRVFSTWSPSTDCCKSWSGVSCDPATGRVADLSLRGGDDPSSSVDTAALSSSPSSLSGPLSPSLCSLPGLTTLILADWKHISGPIPACLPSSLPLLRHLDLVGNQLTGPVPSDIGSLHSLTVLNLADNLLSGPIPASLSSLLDLRHLDLSTNSLTGPLPSDLGTLRMLSRALLSKNQLSGPLPRSIAKMKRLADLDLSSNSLTGRIPSPYGRMPVLSTLNLDSNRLSGPVPRTLLSSRGLGILNLSRNALEGPIPDVFGERSYFMMLDLSYNKLTGRVPRTLPRAKYVGHLDLSHNHLCGPIPAGSPFDHLEASSFADNDCLCGAPLPQPCRRS